MSPIFSFVVVLKVSTGFAAFGMCSEPKFNSRAWGQHFFPNVLDCNPL